MSILIQCLALVSERDDRMPAIKFLAIRFGANDACLKPPPQHVPLDSLQITLGDGFTSCILRNHGITTHMHNFDISVAGEYVSAKGRFGVTRSTQVVGS